MQRFTFKELTPDLQNKIATPVRVFTPTGRVKEALPPPPPPPPTFSSAELKAAERDGYQKGFLEGVKDGRSQIENEQATNEKALLAMLEQFTKSITPLLEDHSKMSVQVHEDMPKLAFAIARKIAGASLAENAAAAINEIVVRCCESLIHESKIMITVHETLGDTLEKRLKEVSGRLPAATDIIIMRSPDIAVTDCRVEWKNGFMERSIDQLLEQLNHVIEEMAVTAVREGAQHLQELKESVQQAQTKPEE